MPGRHRPPRRPPAERWPWLRSPTDSARGRRRSLVRIHGGLAAILAAQLLADRRRLCRPIPVALQFDPPMYETVVLTRWTPTGGKSCGLGQDNRATDGDARGPRREVAHVRQRRRIADQQREAILEVAAAPATKPRASDRL